MLSIDVCTYTSHFDSSSGKNSFLLYFFLLLFPLSHTHSLCCATVTFFFFFLLLLAVIAVIAVLHVVLAIVLGDARTYGVVVCASEGVRVPIIRSVVMLTSSSKWNDQTYFVWAAFKLSKTMMKLMVIAKRIDRVAHCGRCA